MDLFSALALATEPPLASQVKGNPKSQTSLLKQPHIWRQVVGVAVWETLVMLLLFIFGKAASGYPVYTPYGNTKIS